MTRRIVLRETFAFPTQRSAAYAREAELKASGQYAVVTLRRPGYGPTFYLTASVETGETRTQTRGSCPACGALQAVDGSGRIAKHGYKVPRWGYFVGGCRGAGQLAAETSVEFSRWLMTELVKQQKAAEASERKLLTQLKAEDNWSELSKSPRSGYARRGQQPTTADHWLEARRTAQGCRDHARFIESEILPRLGQPLTYVTL